MLARDWNVLGGRMVRSRVTSRFEKMQLDASDEPDSTQPGQARVPFVTSSLQSAEGPIVAVSDYMKAVPDQIARFVDTPLCPTRHRRLRSIR